MQHMIHTNRGICIDLPSLLLELLTSGIGVLLVGFAHLGRIHSMFLFDGVHG